MSIDWFLIDAPHVVPAEFAAWEAAKAHHRTIFQCCIDTQDSAERAALDAEGRTVKIEADRLEQVARDAWMSEIKKAEVNTDTDEDSHRCIYGDVQSPCDDFGGGYPYMVCEICGNVKSLGEDE